MTAGKLRAKMRKLREDFEDEEMENGELNLVPYLDIVTNVIMFLMMTTSFAAALANINVSAPTTSSAAAVAANTEPEQKHNDLNLTVQISDKGFTVAAAGGVLHRNAVPGHEKDPPTLPTIPKTAPDYNYAELTKLMRAIKEDPANDASKETKVIINANPEITYEMIVAAMDAIRNDGGKVLFPGVLLSAGVN